MPIQKRTKKKRPDPIPLTSPSVVEPIHNTMKQLEAVLGQDLSVSVVVSTADGALNIITNERDYDRLTRQLQSIVKHRSELRLLDGKDT